MALDADSGEIVAHCLWTDQDTDDPSQVEPLLAQVDAEIDQFTADGAYDGFPTYAAVLQHSATARIVIPPRITAIESDNTGPPGQRDGHIRAIANDGRLKWQASTGNGNRALTETAIGRYKGLIGRRLRAGSFAAQQTEAAIAQAVLNRKLECARPKSVRCPPRSTWKAPSKTKVCPMPHSCTNAVPNPPRDIHFRELDGRGSIETHTGKTDRGSAPTDRAVRAYTAYAGGDFRHRLTVAMETPSRLPISDASIPSVRSTSETIDLFTAFSSSTINMRGQK